MIELQNMSQTFIIAHVLVPKIVCIHCRFYNVYFRLHTVHLIHVDKFYTNTLNTSMYNSFQEEKVLDNTYIFYNSDHGILY